jgi:hypothetical protein
MQRRWRGGGWQRFERGGELMERRWVVGRRRGVKDEEGGG